MNWSDYEDTTNEEGEQSTMKPHITRPATPAAFRLGKYSSILPPIPADTIDPEVRKDRNKPKREDE
jgi:hypothetical protein